MDKLLTIILIVAILVCGGIFIKNLKAPDFGALTSGYNTFSGGVVNTTTEISSTVSTSTKNLLLAADPDRQWVKIQNIESANAITLQLRNVTSSLADGVGLTLYYKDTFEINVDNLYVGDIYAVASASTNTVSIMYKQ